MTAGCNADASRRLVQVQHESAILTSVSRRGLLRFVGPTLISASLLTQTKLGIAQQLFQAAQKRVAAGRAVAWFNDRDDGLSTRGTIISGTTEDVKKALGLDQNLSITIGRNLTKRKQAYQVWIFGDEFFVFPLTKEQEARLAIGENSVRTWRSSPRKDTTAFPLAADFQALNISDAQGLRGSAKITGSVICQQLKDVRADYALRLTFRTDEYTTQHWTYLSKQQLPPEGPINFTLDEVNSPDEKKPYVGPIVMFACLVSVVSVDEKKSDVLHSNVVAAMVNIVAG